jgi:signal transduction histidine kinase
MHAAFLAFWQAPQSCDPASGGFCAWLLATVHQTARARQRAALAEGAASLAESPIRVQTRVQAGGPRSGRVHPQTLDPASVEPARQRETAPPVRALADESNREYRTSVHRAPEGLEVNDVAAFPDDASAARRLDERQDQLLLTLGHELKTPITVIKGSVQLAHHRLRVGGHLQEAGWLEVANSQIDRLTALVDYLLRAGQLNGSEVALQLARFDLTHLVREVAMTMQALTESHVVIAPAPEDIEIEGDVDRLRQVVTNLVNNAIKYSPDGGKVEVTLRQTGGEALLCVRDHGIGIPVEERDRVFERFERATNVGHIPGFGLGLTMCRDIIQAHHGRIWVGMLSAAATAATLNPTPTPAEDGRGSLFCVALPLSQGAWR